MKRMILSCFFVAAACPNIFSATLLSADHPICYQAAKERAKITCRSNSLFYTDQNGRCGCLESRDVIAPEICTRVRRVCPLDEPLSILHRLIDKGFILQIFSGCGCYSELAMPSDDEFDAYSDSESSFDDTSGESAF